MLWICENTSESSELSRTYDQQTNSFFKVVQLQRFLVEMFNFKITTCPWDGGLKEINNATNENTNIQFILKSCVKPYLLDK